MEMSAKSGAMEVISDPKLFKETSGNFLERLIFNNRLVVIVLCALLTGFFAFQLKGLTVSAIFVGKGMGEFGQPLTGLLFRKDAVHRRAKLPLELKIATLLKA